MIDVIQHVNCFMSYFIPNVKIEELSFGLKEWRDVYYHAVNDGDTDLKLFQLTLYNMLACK